MSRAGAGAALLVVMATCLSACGGGDDAERSSAATGPSYSPSPSAGASSSPDADTSATASPSRPADPVMKTYTRVLRNGKAPRPSVSAAPAPFSKAIRYSDGLTLAVTDMDQATIEDQGPGEFTGDPKTRIRLRMSNGTDSAVRLGQVVVTAVYGDPQRQARPVYDDRSIDFGGVLKAGDSASAAYSFSIPKAQLGRVTVYVDFDGGHTVGTFEGDPRSAG